MNFLLTLLFGTPKSVWNSLVHQNILSDNENPDNNAKTVHVNVTYNNYLTGMGKALFTYDVRGTLNGGRGRWDNGPKALNIGNFAP